MGADVITTTHVTGTQFRVTVRGHELVLDQPTYAGGTDAGPTPTELLVASLGACVAHYARSFLARRGLCDGGLEVQTSFGLSPDPPTRVAWIEVRLRASVALSPAEHAALERVVSHCTVHETLAHPPRVTVALDVQDGCGRDKRQPGTTAAGQ